MGKWTNHGFWFLALGILLVMNAPAQAEMYVAGQFGVTLPNNFTNIEGTGSNAGFNLSDLELHKSVMYGAKLGYYFDSLKWLGVETEVFNTNPNVKQQTATITGGGASGKSARSRSPCSDMGSH